MFDKLKNAEIKFEEINQKLMDPDIISDNEQYKNLMKEYKTLSPLIEKYREYVKAQNNFQEAKELLDNGGLDKDFKEVVQEEYDENKSKMEELTNEIRICFFPPIQMMRKTLLWKYAAAPEARKPLCLPTAYFVCIPCMQKPKAGKQKYST